MPDQNNATQTISDDQELAKVLAGVSAEADDETSVPVNVPLQQAEPVTVSQPVAEEPVVVEAEPAIEEITASDVSPSTDNGSLDGIKKDAIFELRPLVDKLQLAPEEKFDTYLLLLRSTDDRDLIAPAHDAAKAIADESRRAQALLDIIKEIDFLSQSNQSL